MAKLNTNSNTYTIIYASILVILVAFLLAFVSSALKSRQDANVEIDKKQQILSSLNIRNLDKADVDKQYKEVIVKDAVMNAKGEIIQQGENKDQDGFRIENKDINDNQMPIYQALVDGKTYYVVPMTGRGLWGGLWGYISISEDFLTVYGTYFSHESETAGLGALIAEQKFQELFNGKKLFTDEESQDKVALTVVKHGKVQDANIEVDGITGATLTTNGVAEMINSGLQCYIDALHQAAKNNEVNNETTEEGGNQDE